MRAAIEAGTQDRARVANYLKLRDEVAGAADRLATRLAQKAETRGQGKVTRRRPEGKSPRR